MRESEGGGREGAAEEGREREEVEGVELGEGR